jgi:DNA replication and repair protein RecF
MILRKLELDEFRSLRNLRLPVDPAGFRAIGANASGKSTLLEAIAMLATTRSPRTSSEREIAHWQSGNELSVPPYARLKGEFERHDGGHEIEIRLSFDASGQGPLKKQARFDDRPVRAMEAVGQFKTVLFGPEDVNLVSGPPSGRRRYLDIAISQASRDYLRALSQFGRVLEQRNSLLRAFSREGVGSSSHRPAQELPFWNAELAAAAVEVMATRLGAVDILSSRAAEHFASLTGNESLALSYVSSRVLLPTLPPAFTDWRQPPIEFRQALAASMARSLEGHRGEELRRGVTAVGPHRDDLVVTADGVDLGRFGSRGQQRLAVIAIKLAELELLENAAGEAPVLLLDDVLSELDAVHGQKLISLLAERRAQICITATEADDVGSAELAHLPLITIRQGTVVPSN